MPRPKGQPKTGGRKPGVPNRVSREWKESVRSVCANPDAQAALLKACIERPELMFKAAEHAYGKPHQSYDVSLSDLKMINWPTEVATDEDVRGHFEQSPGHQSNGE